MKSRQFPSFDEAINYLEERGTLKLFGRGGMLAEYCIYTFTHKDGRVWNLNVYIEGKKAGLVKIAR